MQPIIVRSKRNGCFAVRTGHWGSYFAACDDPDANPAFTPEAIQEFHVADNLTRIPADLWQRWVQLCFHYAPIADTRSLEVGVRILVNDAGDKYRMLVPKQSVSFGSVHATDFNNSIDIETGEVVETWWPQGWNPCGSSHSHGSMAAFFSSIDDNNELGDPGVHITVGGIRPATGRSYQLVASVTANRKRFKIPFEKLVDTTPIEVTFHPKVLEWVKAEKPPAVAIPGLNNTTTTYGRQYHQGRRLGFHGLDDDDDKAWTDSRGVNAGSDRGGQDAWLPKPQTTGRRRNRRRGATTTKSQTAPGYDYSSNLYSAPLGDLMAALRSRLMFICQRPEAVDILDRQIDDPLKEITVVREQLGEAEDILIQWMIDDALDQEALGEAMGDATDTEGEPLLITPSGSQLLLPAADDSDDDYPLYGQTLVTATGDDVPDGYHLVYSTANNSDQENDSHL